MNARPLSVEFWEAEGVDRRELLVRRMRSLATMLMVAAEHLELAAPDESISALESAIERMHLAACGLERTTGGARREWTVSVLVALATLLKHTTEEEAWQTWLSLQASPMNGEPDGPFLDVTTALVDARLRPLVVAAARATTAPRTGRKPAGVPLRSSYAAIAELFARLPDGAGGTLATTEAALRKLMSRSRKR